MGKRSRVEDGVSVGKASKSKSSSKNSLAPAPKSLDQDLAQLFASSAGPVKAPSRARYDSNRPPPKAKADPETEDDAAEEEAGSGDEDEVLSSVDGDIDDADIKELSEAESEVGTPGLDKLIGAVTLKNQPKRKRKQDDDNLEGKYMQKLAREEEKEEEARQVERRLKRQKLSKEKNDNAAKEEENSDDGGEQDDAESQSDDEDDEDNENRRITPSDVPMHESLAVDRDAVELEKASRTVFLANVATSTMTSKADKKTLLAHLASFIPSLAPALDGRPEHKVESIRFRSTAYAGNSLPKKAAYATKNLMEATTKGTNAYVVYSNAFVAREAPKHLNGKIILGRHLRADSVAHPAKVDHRRCVFVGNLGFVDDESLVDQGGENERKRSKIPSDVEEGLWRQFGKAGKVESVRVIRDEKTRVGKGFAYVQFEDGNAVEEALLYNAKKYPPLLPRILRVVRAKAMNKTALASQQQQSRVDGRAPKVDTAPRDKGAYNPKMSSQQQSLQGRAGKLLGKSGAAQFRKQADGFGPNKSSATGANEGPVGARSEKSERRIAANAGKPIEGIARTPSAIIFEGFRASSKAGKPKDLKMGGGAGKKKGKPRNRATKRTSEWRKGGGK